MPSFPKRQSTLLAGLSALVAPALPGCSEKDMSISELPVVVREVEEVLSDVHLPPEPSLPWKDYAVRYFQDKGVYEEAVRFDPLRFDNHVRVADLVELGLRADEANAYSDQRSAYDVQSLYEAGVSAEEEKKYPESLTTYEICNLFAENIDGEVLNTYPQSLSLYEVRELYAESVDGKTCSAYPPNYSIHDIIRFHKAGLVGAAVKSYGERFSSHSIIELSKENITGEQACAYPESYSSRNILECKKLKLFGEAVCEYPNRFSPYEVVKLYEDGLSGEQVSAYPDVLKFTGILELSSRGVTGEQATCLDYVQLEKVFGTYHAGNFAEKGMSFTRTREYLDLLSPEDSVESYSLYSLIFNGVDPKMISIFGVEKAWDVIEDFPDLELKTAELLARELGIDVKALDRFELQQYIRMLRGAGMETLSVLGVENTKSLSSYYVGQPEWKRDYLTKFFQEYIEMHSQPPSYKALTLRAAGLSEAEFEERRQSLGYSEGLFLWRPSTFYVRCVLNSVPHDVYEECINAPAHKIKESYEPALGAAETSETRDKITRECDEKVAALGREVVSEYCSVQLKKELGEDYAILSDVFMIQNYDQISPETCKELVRIYKEPEYRASDELVVYFQFQYEHNGALMSNSIPSLMQDSRVLVFQVSSDEQMLAALTTAKHLSATHQGEEQGSDSEYLYKYAFFSGHANPEVMVFNRARGDAGTFDHTDADILQGLSGFSRNLTLIGCSLAADNQRLLRAIKTTATVPPQFIHAANGTSGSEVEVITSDGTVLVITGNLDGVVYDRY